MSVMFQTTVDPVSAAELAVPRFDNPQSARVSPGKPGEQETQTPKGHPSGNQKEFPNYNLCQIRTNSPLKIGDLNPDSYILRFDTGVTLGKRWYLIQTCNEEGAENWPFDQWVDGNVS